ncbi:protein rolling stone-like isoform X2 [Apis laboriosa]|uniref:protein rolling stone-like isoform X2 n=1 Tax=Apis laboriosa TaxID=183418 RepID=UPI001CC500DE|nr:protein rolling stone-like isoform X2 [Apis laboriosa]
MVSILYRNLLILKRFLLLFIQFSSCRRTMVNKIWCQEGAKKWFFKKNQPLHPRVLSEPKCQKYVATWYLLYRWLIFMAWACIVICSIFEFGSYKPMLAYDKWPIYMTNWDLVLGFTQALLGGFLVLRRWNLQKVSGFDPSTLMLGSMDRVYLFLYVITTNTAIVITITYWSSIYDPTIHYLDPLNIMLHICNSILMIIDFCITSIPFRLRNFWWCLILVILYIIFSVIYYLVGGVDKNGYHYIYKILDWKKPVQASLVCIGEAVLITILHSLMCFLDIIKNRLYLKIDKKLGRSYLETQMSKREKNIDIV